MAPCPHPPKSPFFFSSRRRHTRFDCDWSSDVCSSDLAGISRQPREVVRAPRSLEIPAGKLDIAGEPPLQTAKRELAEEIGKEASTWEEMLAFHTSPGFSDERVWLYLAADLRDAPGGATAEADERIEVVPWPLDRLQDAVSECEDAKSLVALLWLAAQRGR